MDSLKDISRKLRSAKADLKKHFHVMKIGIFGSYVRGEQKKSSDIDVLVEFEEPVSLFRFLDLEEYLANLLGMKVDLVSKSSLKPRIGVQILKEAVYV